MHNKICIILSLLLLAHQDVFYFTRPESSPISSLSSIHTKTLSQSEQEEHELAINNAQELIATTAQAQQKTMDDLTELLPVDESIAPFTKEPNAQLSTIATKKSAGVIANLKTISKIHPENHTEDEKELSAILRGKVEEEFQNKENGNVENNNITGSTFEESALQNAIDNNLDECTYGIRDYSSPCSSNYYLVGPFCIPSQKYEGSCKGKQATLTMTTIEKQSWSDKCNDSFPCHTMECMYGTDYLKICPSGWGLKDNGYCEAPKEFSPPKDQFNLNGCRKNIQFSYFSEDQKKKYEEKCFVKWPCKKEESCKPDYSRFCPQEWLEVRKNVCKAPAEYTGPCPKYANLANLVGRDDLKMNFEFVCNATWACEVDCERDWNAPCPLGWLFLNQIDIGQSNPFTYQCVAPPLYRLPRNSVCGVVKTFTNADMSIKASFSTLCNASWPCAERKNCAKDFSSRCPIGWYDLGYSGKCRAPTDYEGECAKEMIFSNLSDQDKAALIKPCKMDWPCIGEGHTSLMEFSMKSEAPIN